MRLITGDECGLLKECIPELSRKEEDPNAIVKPFTTMTDVRKDGVRRIDPKEQQSRTRGVIDMVPIEMDDEKISVAALRSNGSIEFWNADVKSKRDYGKYSLDSTVQNAFTNIEYDGKVRPLGVGVFEKSTRVCAGDMLGNIAIINAKKGNVVKEYNCYTNSKGRTTISYTPGNNLNTQLATAMACDTINGRVAIGGRERETVLLDLATGGIVFKAKNLPPDPQTLLQQPVWPSSILFLQDSNIMAVGTAYKQVRLYDVREDSRIRRPTACTPEGLLEYRITSLCQVDEHRLVAADSAGEIYDLDMRTMDRNLKRKDNNNVGRFVGPAGSVRQLKKHPTLPRMAVVGLDRMLRVYDTKSRKQLDCIYLKQRLNCVLFGSQDTWELGEPEDHTMDSDQDIDLDDVVEDYIDSDDEEAIRQKHLKDFENASASEDENDDGSKDEEEEDSQSEEDDSEEEEEEEEASENDDASESVEDDDEDDEEDSESEEGDRKRREKKRRRVT
ncbi:unnamed protein product [Cylindrotheca closterium]|uniref:Ribosome biogenesis protein NSA1 n=1 Tax=Cylindrotheca closterium TaxID=2856 RepID=A0AAD2FMQ9_9STRA|nr:unnamed protein product [Cylindrotheca closterium]